MSRPMMHRYLFLLLVFALCANQAASQTKPPQDSSATQSTEKEEPVRLRLTDGSSFDVDDAWETSQGIWYRKNGLSHLAPRERVKSIERGTPAPAPTPKTKSKKNDYEELKMVMDEVPAPPPPAPTNGVYDKPAWIYLVGGARVEADSATESAAGVWYKRGPMSIFLERSRLDRIEPEDMEKVVDTGKKERGWSTGNSKLDTLIRQNGLRYRVDPYLIFLVIEQESHFHAGAVSPKGARGLMQLMPGTAARFGVRRPHDAAQNVSGGTRYLRELLNRFNNRVDLVLASYNAGEGAVIKYGHRVPPYTETRNYVKAISYKYRKKVERNKAKTALGGAATTAGDR